MQATIVIVGIAIIIMLIQAVRYGSLPAAETTLHAPTSACSSPALRCWSSTC